ncbi:MAG: hypothetical protein RL308_1736 [Bacteroidota bacterium]|jgi:gliding motility-associated-like protein/uncharacterized delta-60 repeat protein
MKYIILLLVLLFSTFLFAQPGSLDATFDNGPSSINWGLVNTISVQPDGKIIVGGSFNFTSTVFTLNLARLNADGTIDISFKSGIGANDTVKASLLQSDGKIIIAGEFYEYDGTYANRIARLNPDGTLDTSFSSGTGPNDDILNLSLQADGKIIIGGYLYSYNNSIVNRMARLNSDGSLDTTFNFGITPEQWVQRTLVLPDGKILVSDNSTGFFNSRLVRLNTDGSVDTTFQINNGDFQIIDIKLQPDGKIIIAGEFKTINGTAAGCIARLNTDGTMDTSFNSGLIFSNGNNGVNFGGLISTVSLQSNGKIIIGGWFDNINGIARNNIARLNKDGSLDLTFSPVGGVSGLGVNSYLVCSTIQSDGKIIVGGQFITYDGIRTNAIVRLNNDPMPPIAAAQSVCSNATVADLTASGTDLKWYDTITAGTALAPTTVLTSATYYVSQTLGGIESDRVAVPVTLNTPIIPIFTQPNDSCPGSTLQPLPTISNNGISGSWSPPLDNTITTTYKFTPTAGSCATTTSVTLTIKSGITPIFTQMPPICSGDIIPELPTLSENNIPGNWSPALNNVATTTYTFTPLNGACANTAAMTITVNPYNTPTFTQIAPVCSGDIITPLPTISNNNITGIWSPALDNSKTTEYTFTPSTPTGSCIRTTKMTITVIPIIMPTFTQVSPICSGSNLNALPTTSNNGITGFWSPIVDNANTKTYTFTPTSGVCATTARMTIIVSPNSTPTFTPIAPICSGEIIPALPTISNNNIAGSWSPTLNNTATTTYTFTPTTGSCATIVPMKIEVLPTPNIELNHDEIICSGNNEMVQLNAGLLSGAQSQYNYEWSRNGLLMPLETGYYLKVKQDGTYTCLVTDKTSACIKTRTNTVIYSNEVTIKNVIISDLTANNTVTIIASGLDNTEYSLDNPNGPFQLSNTFENVEPGFHIVSVKDKNGCGVNSKNIAVVGAPLYFTPNNDGFNDYWKVKGINRLFFKNSKVVIYDRYGKILKVLPNAESEGWDGTFNGHPLPADDYWFVIDLEDGRSANGHFSLKR